MLSFHTGPLNFPAALRLRNGVMTVALLSVGLVLIFTENWVLPHFS